MSTSGSTDFNINRDQLIAGALRLCGAVAQGETPTAAQVTEASEALNMLIKAWQADGMPLWVIKNYTLTLVSGTNTYTVTPKLLKVIQAFNHNTSTNIDVPMRIVTRQEYNVLGNKTSTGNPIQVFSSPELTNTVVKLFPTPDATSASQNQVVLVYQKQFDDMDSASDNLEFPNEWFEAVKYGLATRMAGEYGVSLDDRRQLLSEANSIKQEALSFSTEEGSFFFQADRRDW
jgi:hypothetical protein